MGKIKDKMIESEAIATETGIKPFFVRNAKGTHMVDDPSMLQVPGVITTTVNQRVRDTATLVFTAFCYKECEKHIGKDQSETIVLKDGYAIVVNGSEYMVNALEYLGLHPEYETPICRVSVPCLII